MPLVSIIIPVFNSEMYLETCLDSVLKQTLHDIEIIVINDGSIDQSMQIIEQYASNNTDRIRVFHQENLGQAAARNLGISKATSEYIAFIDSDDYIDECMFELMYREVEQNSADLVVCNLTIEYNYKGVVSKKYCLGLNTKFCSDLRKSYILSEPSPCNKLIHRSLLLDSKLLFPEGLIYEDFAVIPLIGLYARSIAYVNKPLYHYIMHPKSTMNCNKQYDKLDDIFIIVDRLRNNLKTRGFLQQYTAEFEFLMIDHLLFSASYRYLNLHNAKRSLYRIRMFIHEYYPDWSNNEYFRQMDIKYKIVCSLFYFGLTSPLRLYSKLKGV